MVARVGAEVAALRSNKASCDSKPWCRADFIVSANGRVFQDSMESLAEARLLCLWSVLSTLLGDSVETYSAIADLFPYRDQTDRQGRIDNDERSHNEGLEEQHFEGDCNGSVEGEEDASGQKELGR